MKQRAVKAALRARRAALRERMELERARLRARLPSRPKKSHARRNRLLLLAALVLLYLLLRSCDCSEPPPPGMPGAPPPATAADLGPKPPAARPTRQRRVERPRHHGRIRTKVRPAYTNEAPAPQAWLSAFRLQVGARGPRLARCFEGVDRPGALKWTVALDPTDGAVADHQFEAVLAGATLSKEQHACLVQALSTPPYRVSGTSQPGGPSRVSMVIEF